MATLKYKNKHGEWEPLSLNNAIGPQEKYYTTGFSTTKTYPRMCVRGNTYYLFIDNAFVISRNGCNSFGEYTEFANSATDFTHLRQPLDDIANGTPILLKDHTNRIAVFYRANNKAYSYASIRVRYIDENNNISEPTILVEAPGTLYQDKYNRGIGGFWEPFPHYDNFDLYVYFCNSGHSTNGQTIEHIIYNEDYFETFIYQQSIDGIELVPEHTIQGEKGWGRIIGDPTTKAKPGMPSVIQTSNAKYLICENNAVTEGNKDIGIQLYKQKDNVAWEFLGEPLFISSLPGKVAGAPYMLELPDGRITISFQSDCETYFYSYLFPSALEDSLTRRFYTYISKEKSGDIMSRTFIPYNSYNYQNEEDSIYETSRFGSLFYNNDTLYSLFSLGYLEKVPSVDGTDNFYPKPYVKDGVKIVCDNYFNSNLLNISAGIEKGALNLGIFSFAQGEASIAEGYKTKANGARSHTEGEETITSNGYRAQHAEGIRTYAENYGAHSEGIDTKAIGKAAHAEGNNTVALGAFSHIEGDRCEALGESAHAEGTASKAYYRSHAEGVLTEAGLPEGTSEGAHAEGYLTVATGGGSHAQGLRTQAQAKASHSEGIDTIALAQGSHVQGNGSKAFGNYSHASGQGTYATGLNSFVLGKYNSLDLNNSASTRIYRGEFSDGTDYKMSDVVMYEGMLYLALNKIPSGGNYPIDDPQNWRPWVSKDSATLSRYAMVVGRGTSEEKRDNAYTLDWWGSGIYAGSLSSSGADYAEYFEWNDGNPQNEDRAGYFVALEGDKIIKASSNSEVIGVISTNPAMIGDVYEWDWNGKYLKDIYGRTIYENVEIKYKNFVKNEKGEEVEIESTVLERQPKINPEYDPSKPYIPRSDRPEWATVGFLGKLVVIDDGTCVAGKKCSCNSNGIATDGNKYRVLKRLDDSHIQILANFL